MVKRGKKVEKLKVKILPPFLFLPSLIVGLIIHYFIPEQIYPWVIGVEVSGALLIVLGFLVIIWTSSTLIREGESIQIKDETNRLVTSGSFMYSRNPIYFSFVLIYIGISLIKNSFWVLILGIIALILIHYTVIEKEEEYLEDKFGKKYLDYKKKVRRWI